LKATQMAKRPEQGDAGFADHELAPFAGRACPDTLVATGT
jgi:hypothetical protein